MAYDRPNHLAQKLKQIRLALGLSQSEIVKRFCLEDTLTSSRISAFELGQRDPSLLVLLQYARVAGISTDVLIDDELDLPAKLPHDGYDKSQWSTRRRRRP